MAIMTANKIDYTNKKVFMIIHGLPSVGKTSLALTSEKPLLIDLDSNGIARVTNREANNTAVTVVKTYQELQQDLSGDLSAYKTIVVDTGLGLQDLIKDYIFENNKGSAKIIQTDGSLGVGGWGILLTMKLALLDQIKRLDKHIVLIYHSKEEKDGDLVTLRIDCDGSIRNRIWKSCDIGCYIEMQGDQRVAIFYPSAKYTTKGNNGINSAYNIPYIADDVKGTFLKDLIDLYITNLNSKNVKFGADKETYDKAMGLKDFILGASTAEQLDSLLELINTGTQHALTSEKELKRILLDRAKSLGFIFEKELSKFIVKPVQPDENLGA